MAAIVLSHRHFFFKALDKLMFSRRVSEMRAHEINQVNYERNLGEII